YLLPIASVLTAMRGGSLNVRRQKTPSGALTPVRSPWGEVELSTVEPVSGAVDNAEAIEAWDGPLFDRFVKYRHIVVAGLRNHGDEALRLYPPRPGERVLDVGCGFGDT